jgi:sulfonate transport system permease protein
MKKIRKIYDQIAPWIVPILLLIAWQLFSAIGWISERVLPSPLEVLLAAITLTKN